MSQIALKKTLPWPEFKISRRNAPITENSPLFCIFIFFCFDFDENQYTYEWCDGEKINPNELNTKKYNADVIDEKSYFQKRT